MVRRPRRTRPEVRSDREPAVVGDLGDCALQEIGRADEIGDEAVRRSLIQLHRPAGLLDPTVAHDDDRVAHRQRLLLIVGHVHKGDPDLALEGLELELHLLAELEVEGTERLVEEQDRGSVHEGPGERDSLLLAARHLPHPARCP